MEMAPRNSSIRANLVLATLATLFLLSPLLLNFFDIVRARNNAIAVGTLLLCSSLAEVSTQAIARSRSRKNRIVLGFATFNIVIAVWTIFSPGLLGFYQTGEGITTTVIAGMAILATSIYSVFGPSRAQRRAHMLSQHKVS